MPWPSRLVTRSRSHSDFSSRVLYDPVSRFRRIYSYPVVFGYEDYVERTAFQHARKLSFAIANG
jgi:hypothetical protein